MDLTVCIGTFGDQAWMDLAIERAMPSARNQGVPVTSSHMESLAEARNQALSQVRTEWCCFLDADDELEPGYVEAMSKGTADVRAPIVRYMVDGRERNLWQPRVWGHNHDCVADCLPHGNWVVIGAAVRTEFLRAVGGWEDWPWSEDWATWLRCYKAGASFELIRDAVYRAHVRPDSRNRGQTQAAKLAAHEAIHRANFPEQYAA